MIESGGCLIHAPESVEYVGQCQAHGHAAIEKVEGVGFQYAAGVMVIAYMNELTAPFAQSKVEGKGKDREVKPVGYDDVCELSAVNDTDHKTGG